MSFVVKDFMTYAFTFDASSCSGCKACQVACKDKNNLPTGVLWRRVVEVSGGEWAQAGAAWTTDVFAYNLSIACNHCIHPKCAGVCPTDAYVVRPDGVVYIDTSRCVGCGYCSWACPYSAPRYNPEAGHMTKCNFCFDYLDEGKSPACVAACPMRVLDFSEVTSNELRETSGKKLWEIPGTEHPFPLPTFSRTQPHILLKPHVAMRNNLEKVVANQEEIKPRARVRRTRFNGAVSRPEANRLMDLLSKVWCDALHTTNELPLIAFTLLAQMAVGMTVFSLLVSPSFFLILSIGILLGMGVFFSLSHLGKPLNAWRTINHLKKSWLSREILMAGLFGASWLALVTEYWFLKTHYSLLITAFLGFGFVYSMAQVYRIKAVPAWNTWQTNAAFFLSAGVLGLMGVAFGAGLAGAWLTAGVLLAAEAGVMLSEKNPTHKTAKKARGSLILLGMAGAMAMAFSTGNVTGLLISCMLIIAIIEEIIGRWLFYQHLKAKVL